MGVKSNLNPWRIDSIQHNNLSTVFDVRRIPKDTQMREVLDQIPPVKLRGLFCEFLHRLQRSKHDTPSHVLMCSGTHVPVMRSEPPSDGSV